MRLTCGSGLAGKVSRTRRPCPSPAQVSGRAGRPVSTEALRALTATRQPSFPTRGNAGPMRVNDLRLCKLFGRSRAWNLSLGDLGTMILPLQRQPCCLESLCGGHLQTSQQTGDWEEASGRVAGPSPTAGDEFRNPARTQALENGFKEVGATFQL